MASCFRDFDTICFQEFLLLFLFFILSFVFFNDMSPHDAKDSY